MQTYRSEEDLGDEPSIDERIDRLMPSEEELDEEELRRRDQQPPDLGGEFL